MFRRNVFSCLYSFYYFSDEFFIDVILSFDSFAFLSSLFLFFVHYDMMFIIRFSDPPILSIDVDYGHMEKCEKR